MKNPTVSVIIPTYNRAHLVGRAIESVLNQTYKDFEIIVVDDGSTDNTEEVIKQFQKQDKRIKYLLHEKNRGGSAARNTGIKAVEGEYITFLDSDDEWLPEKLEKQIIMFQSLEDKIGFVYVGSFIEEQNTGRKMIAKRPFLKKPAHAYKRMLAKNLPGTCSTIMVRSDIFTEVGGFDEQLTSQQDWDFSLRVARDYQIVCVPEYLVRRYRQGDQISANLGQTMTGVKAFIGKHHGELEKRPWIYGKHLAGLAQLQFLYSQKLGWRTALKALRLNLLQPKLILALTLSLLGRKLYRKVFLLWKKISR